MNKIHFVFAAAALFAAGCAEKDDAGRERYRKSPIEKKDIVSTVEAAGTVTPRNSSGGVPVGAQVNGRLVKLFVDYNSAVTNGQVLALIDPLVYEANYKSAVARLHVAKANVDVAKATLASRGAELDLAAKTHGRKLALSDKGMSSVSDLDSAVEALARAEAAVESAKASLKSAEAAVEQCEADVSQAKANLEYCTIVSPVDGVVIDRKVEEGETVVSSMNAIPVLTIAEDLGTVWIEATVPEADIGGIKTGQKVMFTVDAYRRKFSGRVRQVRRAATTVNNVVTFPVIIEAENPGEMLFPGMTATLSIETARAEQLEAVSAAALRFRPRDEDISPEAGEIPRGPKLWFERDDGLLEAVSVKEGVSNDMFVQVSPVGETPLAGREAVTGYALSASAQSSGASTNPFMPKPPQRNTNKGTAPEPKKNF